MQEKNIQYPTDLRLLNKAHHKLVALAKKYKISLHETFEKFFKKETFNINIKYKSNSQAKTKISSLKKIKTRLGRVIRALKNKIQENKIELLEVDSEAILHIESVFNQSCLKLKDLKEYKKNNRYIYSLHAPETECIAKGKAHKPYEFGNKVSISVSRENNFILAAKSFHDNPYDGHTLDATIKNVERTTSHEVTKIALDRGYKGNDYQHKSRIFATGTKKNLSEDDKKFMRRRNAIEPVIGHLKRFFRMGRNYLKGKIGDVLNPLLAAIGFNLRALCNRLIKKPT